MPANVDKTQVIKKPLVTEKSTFGMNEQKRYAFLVDPRATKDEIKAAVEHLYKVTVTGVNTQVKKGKYRATRMGLIQEPLAKKATVSLKEGDTIELF